MADPDSLAPCRPASGQQLSRKSDPDRDAGASVALYLAGRPRGPEDARGLVDGAAAGREARDADGAVHLQMGDRCAQRHGHRAGRSVELDAVADRLALADDRQLRRGAGADGGIDAVARRHLRPRRDACGAQARLHHLRPHARIVAALPSGAQDRRLDARAGARPHRHRGDRADGDPAVDPDHRRGVAADGGAAVAVRLALRAGHRDHRRDLHVLHLYRDRMADRNPPQDERFRHRGEHQGDRTRCSITRR